MSATIPLRQGKVSGHVVLSIPESGLFLDKSGEILTGKGVRCTYTELTIFNDFRDAQAEVRRRKENAVNQSFAERWDYVAIPILVSNR